MARETKALLPILGLALILGALPLLATFSDGHQETAAAAILAGQASRNLLAGEFAMRWSPDLASGRGGPFFLFHAPGAYYLPGALLLLGVPAAWAILATSMALLIAALALAYLLGRELSGPPGGCIVALTYVFAPAALSSRLGSFESLSGSAALLAPPLVLWAGLVFHRHGRVRHALLVSAGLAWLVMSDVPLAVRLSPLLVLYLLVLPGVPGPGPSRRLGLALAALVAAGATSFFWLPAWAERHLLWDSFLPMDRAPAGAPLASWWVAGLAVGLAALWMPRLWRSAVTERHWALLSVLAGGLALALGTRGTAWLVVAAPMAAGLLMTQARGTMRKGAWILVPAGLLILVAAGGSTRPTVRTQVPWDVPDGFRPRVSEVAAAPRQAPLFPAPAACTLDQEKSSPALHFFDAVCTTPTVMKTELYAYPGWTVTVNNQEVSRQINSEGTLEIELAAGPQRVKVSFEHTPLRRWTRFASLLTLVLGMALTLAMRRPEASD